MKNLMVLLMAILVVLSACGKTEIGTEFLNNNKKSV
jgi:cbb3-type cytochrome oxidase cytochrome c subunit